MGRSRSDFENANAMRNPAGNIYYARMKTKWGIFYKLGYTSKSSLEERLNYGEKNDGSLIDCVLLWSWSDNALHEEQRLHGLLHDKRVFGKYGKFHNGPMYKNGQSELYAEDILDLDADCTESQVKNSLKAVEKIGVEYRNNPIGDHPIWHVVGAVLMVVFSPLILLRKILEEVVPAMKKEKEEYLKRARKHQTDIAAAVLDIKMKSKPYRASSNLVSHEGVPRYGFNPHLSSSDGPTESLDELLALLNNSKNFSIRFSTSTKEDVYTSCNKITRAELKNITELDIYQPCMDLPPPQGSVDIPSAIGQLKRLKKLSFREFKIGLIPDSIANLSELQELHVSGAEMTSLPDFLVKLPRLKILSLPDNSIDSLPRELGEIQTLEQLILPLNELKELPESARELRNLKILRLASNPLSEFPDFLGTLTSLEGLSFDDDELVLTEAQRAWLDRMYEEGKMLHDQYPYCFSIDPVL